jgi:hypothetical protein
VLMLLCPLLVVISVDYIISFLLQDLLSSCVSYNSRVYTRHINTYVYATGEKLVNFMVEPKKGTKWPKELPRFSSRPDAIAVCKELCTLQYILRGEKVAKGELEVSSSLISICTTLLFLVLYCIML